MIDSKQTTVGFKVAALKKKEIEQTAADLGIDVSTYLRDYLLAGHQKVNRLSAVPDELIFNESEIGEALKIINYLKKLNPKYSNSKIMLAALKIAVENESRFISNKIKNNIYV